MQTKPTSAYVHIPFCTQICYYCDFSKVFIKNQPVDSYLEHLIEEPAGELFVATPTSQYVNNPLQGLLILSVWLLVIGGMTSLRFLKTDLGGHY